MSEAASGPRKHTHNEIPAKKIIRAKNMGVFIYGNVHADISVQHSQYTFVCLCFVPVMSPAFMLVPLVKYAFLHFWIFVKKLVILTLFTTAPVSFSNNCVGKGEKLKLNFNVSMRMMTLL